jgi:hypothetical protein
LKNCSPGFKPFSPGGELSIYDFFAKFEKYAEGYLSETAMSTQFFIEFLDPIVTSTYAEIVPLQGNYAKFKHG